MAPHSSTLAWKIPWMEEPGRLQSMRSPESDTTERLHFHFSLWCIGEGNGTPLQCSFLENPRDGGAWRAAIYGVAQSQTRLKRLSSSGSRLVKFIETWSRMVFTGQGGWWGVFNGHRVSVGRWKSSGDGLWWWLHSNVNLINAHNSTF